AAGRPRVLQVVAQSFRRADLPSVATAVLEEAWSLDPADEEILAELLELQVELGESRALFERVDALLELRRPDYAIFERVRSELLSDRFLYTTRRTELAEALDAVLGEVQDSTPQFAPAST